MRQIAGASASRLSGFVMAAAICLTGCSGDSGNEPARADSNSGSATPVVTQSTGIAPVSPQAAPPKLAIDGAGVRLFSATGAARRIDFGQGRDSVIAALAFRGDPSDRGMIEECGAGPLDTVSWSDGLTLYFQDARFVGWAIGEDGERAPTTVSGIGIGSSRAELTRAYSANIFESTLGTEFAAGDLFGILNGPSPEARITHLWAGISCNMR